MIDTLRRARRAPALLAACLLLAPLGACEKAEPPPTREVVRLSGDAYTRGRQHGEALRSKIRSFYTTLLETSLLPYLGRQQPDIAEFLVEYKKAKYLDGKFSYELLLASAKAMEKSIPRSYKDELQGIADGSGLTYEQILILNTFVDTVMAVRGVAAALHASGAPRLVAVEFQGVASDGVDNDGDGEIDEAGEGTLDPFAPSAVAALVEVPPAVKLRLTLVDADGVDPGTVRLQLDDRVFEPGSPEIVTEPDPADPTRLFVTFTPPAELAGGAISSVVVQAGDSKIVEQPAPPHARFMRDERITFSVKGAGRKAHEIANRGFDDGRTQPPALAFAARGAATGGDPLLAQHFALLDANTAHKHTAIFVHKPEKGPAFAVVGWAGVIWGFSGLNNRGLAYACNYSDSLDNSVVAGLMEQISDISAATLVTSGLPIGLVGRRMLETAADVDGALGELQAAPHTYGWNCLLTDEKGGMKAAEVDSNLSNDGGVFVYGPEHDDPANLDAHGRPLASVGGDDLRIGSHYQRNTEDIFTLEVAGQRIVPQRAWSSYWYRSLRAFALLGEELSAQYGKLNVEAAKALLGKKGLVDTSDSMNAVVIEPKARKLHVAMGQVPATSGEFEVLDLAAEAQ